tara:strand:- start:280 stop:693 length:414 start_codon:yes stop_codon:yes gene_type:complete
MERKMNIEKIENRVKEIDKTLEGDWKNIDSHALIMERGDKEFILNKRGVNVRLTGNNKYYWACQFKDFRTNISKYGTWNYKAIDGTKISFHKYSINESYSQYSNDFYRFDSADEMKGFVKGYNAMSHILNLKEKGIQ